MAGFETREPSYDNLEEVDVGWTYFGSPDITLTYNPRTTG